MQRVQGEVYKRQGWRLKQKPDNKVFYKLY